jgi:hypothetical protein
LWRDGRAYKIAGEAARRTHQVHGDAGLRRFVKPQLATLRTNDTNTGAIGALGWTTYGVNCVAGSCGGNAAWTNYSDVRLKTRVKELDSREGLAAVMKLRPVSFRWKDIQKNAREGRKIGFIAQDMQQVFPEVVENNGADVSITLPSGKTEVVTKAKSIAYSDLVVPLVKAVQELKADNDNLRSSNASLHTTASGR